MNLDRNSDHLHSEWDHAKNQVGSRFEAEFNRNTQFRIEDLLPRLNEIVGPLAIDTQEPGFVQDVLAELIYLEMELKSANGEIVDRFAYHRRFPDFVTIIDKVFERIRKLQFNSHVILGTVSVGEESSDVGSKEDTRDWRVDQQGTEQLPNELHPYEGITEIAAGAFGVVCRAIDSRTGKRVAIKFPRKRVFKDDALLQWFLQEAARVSKLDHPGIAKTYSVKRIYGYLIVVQQLIEGKDLQKTLYRPRTHVEIAELVAQVADALGYAAKNGIVHRDLKPSNILLDATEKPFVIDFGMALDESAQLSASRMRCGTVPYMSPQLVAGLTKNLDGRTDIWSLGVILYEMLVHKRPFRGLTERDIYEQIETRDPKPLRQIDSSIPEELERICSKCLQKRARDRYLTADDLAEDLRNWINHKDVAKPGLSSSKTNLVPAGLRSYGMQDSDFFLDLLPGPRDRDYLPASIGFWKVRICEPVAGEDRVPVGVLYGPSGSGKSSFVKAGLLPQLDHSVEAVYVEATRADTEVRVVKALRARFPGIPDEISFPELLEGLSHGHWQSAGKKTFIVLDQFEQRLSLADDFYHSQLAKALRHCDGERLQCLLLIRDDFWLALTRFADALEMDLLSGKNSRAIDPFDRPHAEYVLIKLGRAYQQLPDESVELGPEPLAFVERAVEQMQIGHEVICSRLSLFAEMFKSRPWTTAELKSVGGAHAVGENFLDETFGAGSSSRQYRLQRGPAQGVFEALLPDSDADIRGAMKSENELLVAAHLEDRPNDFRDLIRILDTDLKLITRITPDMSSEVSDIAGPDSGYYQLTHDFLVPPIRQWLTTELRTTRRGRARLRLAELASQVAPGAEPKYLPTHLEWLTWQYLLIKYSPNDCETLILNLAQKKFFKMAGLAALLIAIVGSGIAWWRMQN